MDDCHCQKTPKFGPYDAYSSIFSNPTWPDPLRSGLPQSTPGPLSRSLKSPFNQIYNQWLLVVPILFTHNCTPGNQWLLFIKATNKHLLAFLGTRVPTMHPSSWAYHMNQFHHHKDNQQTIRNLILSEVSSNKPPLQRPSTLRPVSLRKSWLHSFLTSPRSLYSCLVGEHIS